MRNDSSGAGMESNGWNCVQWLTSVPVCRLVIRTGFGLKQRKPSYPDELC